MKELPTGLRIDRGYLQVRLFSDGKTYFKNFGKDSEYGREAAMIHLSEIRKQVLLWKAGALPNHPFDKSPRLISKKFEEVALSIYLPKWSSETDADGNKIRNEKNAYLNTLVVKASLIPFFGRMKYDSISPSDIESWRTTRLSQGVAGTTVNREQNVLSSLFSNIESWMQADKIKTFKLPVDKQGKVYNPCRYAAKSSMKVRERQISKYELSKLKLAFKTLGDQNGCDNICLALKTTLSYSDLQKLKFGDVVDLNRGKTGVAVNIPVTVWYQPNWKNWRKRWLAAIKESGIQDIEFRDLRKAGGNLLVGKHDMKLISQYMGHASEKTTEKHYTQMQEEKMRALAQDLSDIVDSL